MTANRRISLISLVATLVVYSIVNFLLQSPEALTIALITFFGFITSQHLARISKQLSKQ